MKHSLVAIAALCFTSQACVGLDTDLSDDLALAKGTGQLSLEWVILSGETLQSCLDVGAAELEVAVLGASEFRERTSCYGGFAVVDGLLAGKHWVEVGLVSPDGDRLVTADMGEVEVVAGATVPLGAVELAF